MPKRNLTLAEKKAVKASMPRLNVDNWMMFRKHPDHYILKHKLTGTKKRVPIQG
jgi:hypothetical protein